MTSARMVETSVTNKTPSQNLNQLSEQILAIRFFIKKWSSRRILSSNKRIIIDAQSSLRKQADFIQRILCGSRRILRSPMPNENPGIENLFLFIGKTERNINLTRQNLAFFFLFFYRVRGALTVMYAGPWNHATWWRESTLMRKESWIPRRNPRFRLAWDQSIFKRVNQPDSQGAQHLEGTHPAINFTQQG